MPPQRKRKAVIYCRLSQDRDGDEEGVDRQEKFCRALATREQLDVVEVFRDDNISGYSGKRRPGYEAMVDLIKNDPSIDVIVAFAPDRLTRHPRELEDLIDLLEAHRIGVKTHAAGDYSLDNSGGRMVARAVGAVARHESEVKSERLKAKVNENAEAGRFHGGQRPYGYVNTAEGLKVDRVEAKQIRYMVRRLREGGALRAIAAELTDKGVPTTQGLPQWRNTSVRRILRNPAIAGLRHHRGEIVGQAAWPAIIERDEWEQVQAILSDPARKQARPGTYLLSGGLTVTEDGTSMTGAVHRTMRMYHGPGASINADLLERAVVEYVLDRTDRSTPKLPKRTRQPSEVAKIEAELVQLAHMRERNEMELQEWVIISRGVRERLEQARKQAPPAPVMPAGIADLLSRKGGLRRSWDTLSHDQQRRALAAVLDKVIVHPLAPGQSNHGPANADRVEFVLR
jgi:site-specific DNA recombinase